MEKDSFFTSGSKSTPKMKIEGNLDVLTQEDIFKKAEE